MIRIELAQNRFRLGEHVKGEVVWTSEGKREPRGVRVWLRWRIAGKGTIKDYDLDTAEAETAAGQAQVRLPFDFYLPRDTPPSYEGELFQVMWFIQAEADLPMALDEEEARTIEVLPAQLTPAEMQQALARGGLEEEDFVGEDEDFDEDEETEETLRER